MDATADDVALIAVDVRAELLVACADERRGHGRVCHSVPAVTPARPPDP
jgi:hypothetical protein